MCSSDLKPRDFLFIPSNADYKVSKKIVVEAIEGDPLDLINRNLFQDSVAGLPKATSAVSDAERIVRDGKESNMLNKNSPVKENDLNFSPRAIMHRTTPTI